MLAIRLQRNGRKGMPLYRIVVQEAQRHPLSGRIVAQVGSYNPHTKATTLDKAQTGPVVMCGDLNVIAESPAMRTLDFLTDLTPQNNVKTTLQNLKFVKDVACDHILINDQVTAKNFTVHDNLVSDHKTISAEIELI